MSKNHKESFDENFNRIFNDDSPENTPIRSFLKDIIILLTGGFGFLGKLLIQKLLDCDVFQIFLMVRGKKGKSIDERMEALKSDPVSFFLISHIEILYNLP